MADCFSLPNAAELVEQLRSASELGDAPSFGKFGVIVSKSTARQAADAIEQLLAENAKLKVERDTTLQGSADAVAKLWAEINALRDERDAAVADIPHRCYKCKYEDSPPSEDPCSNCRKSHYYGGTGEFTNWEWRGVKEKEDD